MFWIVVNFINANVFSSFKYQFIFYFRELVPYTWEGGPASELNLSNQVQFRVLLQIRWIRTGSEAYINYVWHRITDNFPRIMKFKTSFLSPGPCGRIVLTLFFYRSNYGKGIKTSTENQGGRGHWAVYFITLVPMFYNNVFLSVGSTTLGTYWIFIGWFIKLSVQTFQPLTVI